MNRTGLLCALLASSILPAQQTAQQTTAQQPPQPTTPEHVIGGLTFQATLRTRTELWDWFHADTGDHGYAYSGNILRFGLSQTTKQWDWQAEFVVPFLFGLPSNAVAPGVQGQLGLGAAYFINSQTGSNTAMLFPKQVSWRWKNIGGVTGQSLRLGRFEYADSAERTPHDATLATLKRDRIAQRLIGTFAFTHVAHSFDGFQYVLDKPAATFAIVSAIPTRGVFQTDGWGETRTGFTYAGYTRGWGRGNHTAETRVLGIYYQDWRHLVKADSRPLAVRRTDLANIRIGTFGGHHLSAITSRAGTVDLLLWGVAQTGRWGIQDHRAHAFAAEGGFQPRMTKWRPWLRAGYFESSGDGKPNDNVHESFFNLMPSPRPFARFPFFNLMNDRDVNAALISRPHGRVTISNEFHALRLSSNNDLWYIGGGVYQPWTFGYSGRAAGGARSLANLYDMQVDYRVNPAVSVTGYFGFAQGLAVTRAIYPKGKDAQLGYVELNYRF
jgi:alginate export protein